MLLSHSQSEPHALLFSNPHSLSWGGPPRGSHSDHPSVSDTDPSWDYNLVLALSNWTTPSPAVLDANQAGAGPSGLSSFPLRSERPIFQLGSKRPNEGGSWSSAKRPRYFESEDSDDSEEEDSLAETFDPETFYRRKHI